jgi:pimeloyl-ACP methyl ester carboxylesterase
MRNWTVISRLPNITAPTLVYNGEFDTSQDIANEPFFEHIPRVRWLTVSNASHMIHLESDVLREKVMTLVGEFLAAEQKAGK